MMNVPITAQLSREKAVGTSSPARKRVASASQAQAATANKFAALLKESPKAGALAQRATKASPDKESESQAHDDLFAESIRGSMDVVNLKALSLVSKLSEQTAAKGSEIRLPITQDMTTDFVDASALPEAVSSDTNFVRLKVNNSYYSGEGPLPGMGADNPRAAHKSALSSQGMAMGSLSALFESGPEGVGAIGYDRVGGTSYGKYQIASQVGTMDKFVGYLKEHEPTYAKRLTKSGSSNTGSVYGGFPKEWKKIASENPKRFEELQDNFIRDSHYQPAVQGILEETKINVEDLSPVMKEVVLSTAVQHGPNGAVRIVAGALKGKPGKAGTLTDKDMIEEIYRMRKLDFGASTNSVRAAVKARLTREKEMAIEMLAPKVQKAV